MKRTLDEWESLITNIVTRYKKLDAVCNAASKAGTLDLNGPLYNAIWRAFNFMLETVDVEGWISWYLYDNDQGKRKLKAGSRLYRGKPIITPKALAKLITESEFENP